MGILCNAQLNPGSDECHERMHEPIPSFWIVIMRVPLLSDNDLLLMRWLFWPRRSASLIKEWKDNNVPPGNAACLCRNSWSLDAGKKSIELLAEMWENTRHSVERSPRVMNKNVMSWKSLMRLRRNAPFGSLEKWVLMNERGAGWAVRPERLI